MSSRRTRRRGWRRSRGDSAGAPGEPNLAVLLGVAAAQPLSAFFDPSWTEVTIVNDAGTDRMTEMRSRPIAGQLQYDLGPVATPLGPAVSTTPKVGPTDDGKRVLSFGGTQYLAGAATLAAQFVGLAPFTAVWLASRSVGGAAAHWALDDVGATDNRIAQFLSGGDLQSSHRTAAGAQTSASGSVTVLNEVYVHSIVFDGAQVATWLDGVASIPPTANTRAPATLDELVLGAQRSGAALVAFMRGLGGVLWICSGALSTPSRQAVESAMGAYYGYPL